MSLQDIFDDVNNPLEWAVELDSVRRDPGLSFSASTSQVSFGDILDPAAGDSLTVEWVASSSDLASNMFLGSKKSAGGTSAGWAVSVGLGTFTIRAADGATEVTASFAGAPHLDGSDKRITFVIDRAAQVMRLYIDGILIITSGSIAAVGSLASASPLLIGNRGAGAQPWVGRIEDFRYWTVARTQAQIASTLRRGAVTGPTAGLAILARLTDGEGTSVADISGNGRNGTITGATWTEISKTWYFSTHARSHGTTDVPANTEFLSFILPDGGLGPFAQSLSEDALFGGQGATVTPGSLTVVQPTPTASTDRLSSAHDYTFAGREARIKVGVVGNAYSTFESYRTFVVDKDPDVVLTDTGLKAEWQLASIFGQLLAEELDLPKYVGIQHCLKLLTASSRVIIPRVAAHDAPRFVASVRFRMNGNPAAARRLIAKFLSTTDSQVLMQINANGSINIISSSSGAADINHNTARTDFADNKFHVAFFARDDADRAYFGVDREVLATWTPTGNTNLTVNSIAIGFSFGSDDIEFLDARWYNAYIPPEELIGILATLPDPTDARLVGYWPFTDNGGAVVNDEGSGNSDGAILGVLNTDYSWEPSDLGEPALAGRPYPFAIGDVYNVQAHLIDSVRERYRVTSEDYSGGVLTVKSQGTQLTGGGVDYTEYDNKRIVQMTSQEAEPVTFDRSHVATLPSMVYPTQLAYDALVSRTRLTAADISQRYDSMKSIAGWRAGFHSDSNINGAQLLKALLGDAGMYYTESMQGLLYMDMLLPPVGYGPFGDPAFDFNGGRGTDLVFPGIGSIAGSSMTICGWINTPAVNGTTVGGSEMMYIAGTSSGTGGEYNLRFQNRSGQYTQLRFGIAGNGTLDSAANPLLPFTWYFVAAVFNDAANTMTLYLGKKGGILGAIAAMSAPNARAVIGIGDLVVGSRLGEDAIGWGALQHAQIYDAAKSYSDLVAIMANPSASPANLVRWVPMNEGSGIPVEEVNDITATVNGLDHFTHRWAPKFTIDLDTNPGVRLTDLRRAAPVSMVDVLWGRNWHPTTEVDTGLSQAARWAMMREWKNAPLWLDSRIATFKKGRTVQLESPIVEQSGAYALARLLASRLNENRWLGSLSLPERMDISRQSLGLAIGDEVGIKAALPNGVATVKSFRVTAVSPDPLKLSNTVNFWG